MKPNDEETFLAIAKDLLEEGVRDLSPEIKMRLEEARIAALTAAGESRWKSFLRERWIMFGSFATAATAAVAAFLWLHTSPGVLPARQIEDFEIVTSQERMDFYQNLDFYQWLATSENDRAEGKAS